MKSNPMRKTADLSLFDNSWYHPGGSVLKRAHGTPTYCFHQPAESRYSVEGVASEAVRCQSIKPSMNIKCPWKLSIGDNTWIGEGVWIDNDQETINETLLKAICTPESERLQMGVNDNLVREKYSVEILGTKMKRLYQWIIGGGQENRVRV